MQVNVNATRLLERFLRYVQVGTTANPDSANYPSSDGQLKLGRMIIEEMRELGLDEVLQDEHGLVWGTIPATATGDIPTILFNAHLDTSPDAPGENVRPQVVEDYQGGDIPLSQGNQVICVADCPTLKDLIGHTLVTTDGTTLLGGDDKAGVAAIMELAATLIENPHLPHGPIRILFTCDEEIGRGAQHMDLTRADADAGYTLDGSGEGHVEHENFSADELTVRVNGKNIHPSIAKGQMRNATRALAHLIAQLPIDRESPESTEGREGFMHPYSLHSDVGCGQVKMLLRDFDTSQLDEYERAVERAAEKTRAAIPGIEISIQRERQYRNMADFLAPKPHVVALAVQAHEDLGRKCHKGSIRGGTDGAMFSELGLPTPNLSVGQHNIHSVLEFASLNEMVAAVEHAIKLAELWNQYAKS